MLGFIGFVAELVRTVVIDFIAGCIIAPVFKYFDIA